LKTLATTELTNSDRSPVGMQILNLIQCANLGGMEQASLRLMRGLQTRGHSCELLSLNSIGALGPLLNDAGIHHEGLQYAGKGGWRIMLQLRQKLREKNAVALLMTGHHLFAMLVLGDFCRGRRVLAIHFHHAGVKPDWQWRLIYRLACARFQAITFPSDFIRREAECIHPPVASIAHTIRNPLALPSLPSAEQRQTARRKLGLPAEVPIIGNAGWLIPRKRFDVFLRTAAIIAAQCPDMHFVIAGDGAERDRLKTLASNLKLSHLITWTGWVQNMEGFYSSLDMLVFNSDWDALPTTPLEAMSYGVPVVASVLNGGLKEILNSNQCGVLLNRHDTETLAAEVVRLLRNPTLAKEVGLAGRERIRITSHPDHIAAEYEKLLLT
jgi:glycosyltransferase involved in cell wall biosynthesis